MKILTYEIEGYTYIYNPETEETEKKFCPAPVVVKNPTEEAIEIAKLEAYNGEYTIEDDGQPEPETPETPDGDDLTADEMAAAIMEGVNEA